MGKGKILQAVVEMSGSISPTLASSIQSATKQLGGLNVKALAVGAAVAGVAVGVGKGLVDGGKYLKELGGDFKQVEKTIRIGTGATGEALKALNDDFDQVYKSVPTTMETAGQAITDYNKRLGLTGEGLQDISIQAIQVEKFLGEDLDSIVTNSSQAFQQWEVSTDKMSDSMDWAFKVSQSTGVGFSDLLQDMRRFGPQLQEMGYSFETASAMIGQMEKAGINTSEVLGAMKKGVGALAKEGISASDGIQMYFEKIKNAGDVTEATTIASEIFGARAGSGMAAAIRNGSLAIEDFTAELSANGDTIRNVTDGYGTIEGRIQLFKQNAEVALRPLADTIFNSVGKLLPLVTELTEGVVPILEDMCGQIIPIIEGIVPAIMPALQQLLPIVLEIAGSLLTELIPPLVEIMTSIIPVIVDLLTMLAPILNTFVSGVLPIIVALIQKLIPPIMQIIEAILPILVELLEAILPMLDDLLADILPVIINLIDMLLPLIMDIIEAVLPILMDLLKSLMPIFKDIIKAVLPVIMNLLESLLPIFKSILEKILPVIVKLLKCLLPIITKLITAVLPMLVKILDALMPILDLVIALLEPILDLFIMLLEPILSLISMAIEPLAEIIGMLMGDALEPLMPIIEFLAELFSNVLGGAIEGISEYIGVAMELFQGLIDFVKCVFTGDWEGAWEAVVGIFKSYFEGLKIAFKIPINWIIDGLNTFLAGIGKIEIPKWVPKVGGKSFDIPVIPRLATGGFTEGLSFAGEAGMEAVISFDPAYRKENIGYWERAGQLLGVYDNNPYQSEGYWAAAGRLLSIDDFSLSEMAGGQTVIYYDFSGLTWSPQFASGGMDEDFMAKIKAHEAEFFDWLEEFVRVREEGQFCRV